MVGRLAACCRPGQWLPPAPVPPMRHGHVDGNRNAMAHSPLWALTPPPTAHAHTHPDVIFSHVVVEVGDEPTDGRPGGRWPAAGGTGCCVKTGCGTVARWGGSGAQDGVPAAATLHCVGGVRGSRSAEPPQPRVGEGMRRGAVPHTRRGRGGGGSASSPSGGGGDVAATPVWEGQEAGEHATRAWGRAGGAGEEAVPGLGCRRARVGGLGMREHATRACRLCNRRGRALACWRPPRQCGGAGGGGACHTGVGEGRGWRS